MGGDLGQPLSKPIIGSQGLGLNGWHQRYRQQAQWTQDLRQYLFAKAQLQDDDHILEVGSGTSAVLQQLAQENYQHLTGIDIDRQALKFSKHLHARFNLAQADGCCLPFPAGAFGLCFCHYLLLWVQHPVHILSEMRRVTRQGGMVLALAEPDHQSRIDFPPPLAQLGILQTQALEKQGADTQMGRKLSQLFHQAGLDEIEVGILGAQWSEIDAKSVDEIEWNIIQADLADQLTGEQFTLYREADREARAAGKRILFIPTFYASGIIA